MKILLLQPPSEGEVMLGFPRDYATKARSPLPPLGLLYLSSYLKAHHDVQVVDMSAQDLGTGDVGELIRRYRPGLVGISCVVTKWPPAREIARQVKLHDPGITVVAGGPNPTFYPLETLTCEHIDYVIRGSGLEAMRQLCDRLDAGRSGDDIADCFGRACAPSGQPAPPRYASLDDIPFPDRVALPIDLYQIPICPENPTTSILSSQGCYFRCAFCASKYNKPQIMRSFEKVVDEMEAIEGLGIRSVMFQDDLFTFKPERVRRLCEALIARGIGLHWTVKSRVDCLQEWMPTLMKEAGCFNVHFGIESGSDETLRRMSKNATVAQARAAVEMVKKAGLSCTGNFILGYPGEDEGDVYATLDFARELALDMTQFQIALDLPGTELYAEAVAAGRRPPGDLYRDFVLDPDHTDLSNLFASDRLGRDRLLQFQQEANAAFPTFYGRNGKRAGEARA